MEISIAINGLRSAPTAVSTYKQFISASESVFRKEMMEQNGQNQSRVSELLGINRGTLRKKLIKYGFLITDGNEGHKSD